MARPRFAPAPGACCGASKTVDGRPPSAVRGMRGPNRGRMSMRPYTAWGCADPRGMPGVNRGCAAVRRRRSAVPIWMCAPRFALRAATTAPSSPRHGVRIPRGMPGPNRGRMSMRPYTAWGVRIPRGMRGPNRGRMSMRPYTAWGVRIPPRHARAKSWAHGRPPSAVRGRHRACARPARPAAVPPTRRNGVSQSAKLPADERRHFPPPN